MQNSTVVFQLNLSNNISFCASISRANAKPQPVNCNLSKNRMKYKVSEKRAEFLREKFFEYSLKGVDLDQETLNNISEPIELDFIIFKTYVYQRI